MSKKQSGFTAIEVIIGIAVIGVIGIVGWLVIGRKSKKTLVPQILNK
jgi:prepilin-type N-terminal cleavage/methylation domain-containing protein